MNILRHRIYKNKNTEKNTLSTFGNKVSFLKTKTTENYIKPTCAKNVCKSHKKIKAVKNEINTKKIFQQ